MEKQKCEVCGKDYVTLIIKDFRNREIGIVQGCNQHVLSQEPFRNMHLHAPKEKNQEEKNEKSRKI